MTTILQTERLLLRHFIPGDLEALFEMYRDPQVRRFFPDGTLTYEETREEMEWYFNGHPQHPELGLWAAVLRASGRLVGRCGLLPWTIDGREEVEIAYLIDKASWGQGLGTEAARAIRDYAFEQLGLTRLICLIDEHNQASIRVAEKLGMAFEKAGRDELGPFQLYAMAFEPEKP
jgi:RimJ/RimL family protein N-acetyltransferase